MQNYSSSFTFVLFGGTGDLSMRKILPALFEAHRANMLAESGRIVAVARHNADRAGYHDWVAEHVKLHVKKASGGTFEEASWERFLERIDCLNVDLGRLEDYQVLREAIGELPGTRVFYLATGPSLFEPICKALAGVGISEGARIVLEKPLELRPGLLQRDQRRGWRDLRRRPDLPDRPLPRQGAGTKPARTALRQCAVRAAVAPRMGREYSDHDRRGTRRGGARRLLRQYWRAARHGAEPPAAELLSIIAMEPPHSIDSDPVRDEKLRVLKPIDPRDISKVAVRGQYHAGTHQGHPGARLRDRTRREARHSNTETYVALKVEIENWRWAGVPFFLRTGKRLADRVAEIVVNFRAVPHSSLDPNALRAGANRLVIRLQPNETIRLYCLAKQSGEGMNLASVHIDLAFDQFFKEGQMEAYQRLLLDMINGRLALFVRRDEQEAAWRWVEPIQNEWQKSLKAMLIKFTVPVVQPL